MCARGGSGVHAVCDCGGEINPTFGREDPRGLQNRLQRPACAPALLAATRCAKGAPRRGCDSRLRTRMRVNFESAEAYTTEAPAADAYGTTTTKQAQTQHPVPRTPLYS